jgi:hypothetical protein
LHIPFSVVGKPRIIYGLSGAIVKLSAAAQMNSSLSSHQIVSRTAHEDAATLHKNMISEFQRMCGSVDSEMIRFCGFCGHQITTGCSACTVSSFHRRVSYLSDKTIKHFVSDRRPWTVEQLPIFPVLQGVLFHSEDSNDAAYAICSMLNSVHETQLRSLLFFGHHTRPLSFSASDCSSVSNFMNSFGIDSVSLQPNIKSSSGDILHRLLHNFCSSAGNDWRSASASSAHLPVFDLSASGSPDALFRSIPLELKSVDNTEKDCRILGDLGALSECRSLRKFPPSSSALWKWLRQISVYQRSHSLKSHRALLVIVDRGGRRIGAYEVSPQNISYFDSYCLKQLARRPALALYLDAIRPYCNSSLPGSTRSSSVCEIFSEQKKATKSAMSAHAELLQKDLEEHFTAANAFILAIRKLGTVPETFAPASFLDLNSNSPDIDMKVPDFERSFVNWRMLAQLFNRLQRVDDHLRMEKMYAEAVDVLMQSARACHEAALISYQKGDRVAASRCLKFIKSLLVLLRKSPASSKLEIQAMSVTGIAPRIEELTALAHSDFSHLPSESE